MSKRIVRVLIAGLALSMFGAPAEASTINLTLNCSASATAQNQYVTGGDVLVYTVTNADQINDRWPAGTSYLLESSGSTVASGTTASDTSTTFSNLTTSSTYTLTVTLPNPIPSAFVSNSMHTSSEVNLGKSGTNCSRGGNTVNNVIYFVNDPSMSAGSSSSSSSSSPSQAELAAQAAAKAAAAVLVAKQELVSVLKTDKPLSASQLSAADIRVNSDKALARVNEEIGKLTEDQKTDLAVVATIVRTSNFIDKVSTVATQAQVTTPELVVEKLISVDYKYKASVLRAIVSADPASVDTLEKIAAVVKGVQDNIQARKDRIAALRLKISGAIG